MFLHILIMRPFTGMDVILIIQLLVTAAPSQPEFEKLTKCSKFSKKLLWKALFFFELWSQPFTERVTWKPNFPARTWEVDANFDFFQRYHSTFRDTFNFEALAQRVNPPQPTNPTQNTLPTYFGYVIRVFFINILQFFSRMFLQFIPSFKMFFQICWKLNFA